MKWFSLIVLLATGGRAAVAPGGLFTNRMVLQRDQEVKVYGTADDGEVVTVSFNGQTVKTTARDRRWRVTLKPMKYGGPFTMTITGRNRVIFKDILIGDVWVLSGQSNMGRPMRSFPWLMKRLPKLEESKQIRLFCMKYSTAADKPSNEIITQPLFNKSWQHCTRKFLPEFSPLGYFFGIHRYKMNRVPLGLIYAARGATSVQSWTPKSVLVSNPAYKSILDKKIRPVRGKPNPCRPCALYNGMIHPLHQYTIKGVLWNQGESDSKDAETYALLFPTMIRCWRKAWGEGDFPFVYAQISSNKDRGWGLVKEPCESSWAWQRESQAAGLKEPNTFMVTSYDIGEWEDIHPQDKETLGKRYALGAAKLAGEDVIASGPRYKSHRIQKNRMIISFDAIHGGIEAKRVVMNKKKNFEPGKDPDAFVAEAGKLVGFVMCGPDRCFHAARATIQGNEVAVTCDKVEHPVAVRYAWATFALANLYNKAGFPAYPFRTDTFDRKRPYVKNRKPESTSPSKDRKR